jgi:oligosaccharide repeat unit polymerase
MILLNIGNLANLVPFQSMTIVSLSFIVIYLLCRRRSTFAYVFPSLVAGTLLIGIAGERDFLLRIIILIFVALASLGSHHYRRIMPVACFIVLLLIPRLADFRNTLLGGAIRLRNSETFLQDLATSEFLAASRNLIILLENRNSWEFQSGRTFAMDFQNAFFGGDSSGVTWFNQNFFYNSFKQGGGYGFSLVGESYLNFGTLGVIIIFALFGLFMRICYRNSARNKLFFASYISLIPMAMYSVRSDLTVLFAYPVKHILSPVLTIVILARTAKMLDSPKVRR